MNQNYRKMMVYNIYHNAWCKFTYFNMQNKQQDALKTKSICNWIYIVHCQDIRFSVFSQTHIVHYVYDLPRYYYPTNTHFIWRKDERNVALIFNIICFVAFDTTPSLLIQSAGSECDCCCGCELQMSNRPSLYIFTCQ